MKTSHFVWALLIAAAAGTPSVRAQGLPLPENPLRVGKPYDGFKLVRCSVKTQDQLDLIDQQRINVWSERVGIGPLELCVSPAQLKVLQAQGLACQVLIEDVQAEVDREAKAPVAKDAGWFGSYHSYAEIQRYLDGLVEKFPQRARRFVAGRSVEGREIGGIRIGGPHTRYSVCFQGAQHAREWVAASTPVWVADRLLTGAETDPSLAELIEEIEFLIVPVVNPDGYAYSRQGSRLWRKNRRGGQGVDLNRNWSFGWGGPGASERPWSDTYRGPSAFSEPESKAMAEFMKGEGQRLKLFVDIHSYSQMILQPWGYTRELPHDHDRYQALGAEMVRLIADVHGTQYTHGPAARMLYVASGDASDWAKGELGVLTVTFELRPRGGGRNGFTLSPSQIVPAAEEVFPALVYLAVQAGQDGSNPTAGVSAARAASSRGAVTLLEEAGAHRRRGHARLPLPGTFDN